VFPKSKYVKKLIIISFLLLLVAIPPIVYFAIQKIRSLTQNVAITLQTHVSPSGKSLQLPPLPTPSTSTSHVSTGCGITKNHDGTYSFSWLHTAPNGNIVDANNCTVHLLGLNQGWLASGATGGPSPQEIAAWNQAIPMNLVRIPYNSYWWDTDVYVPRYRMHFRQLLQNFVSWNEHAGRYVELDTHTQFAYPPCGNDGMGVNVTYCSTEVGPVRTLQDHEAYQPRALQGLTDLAKLYATDSAVIFDVWNEPAFFSPPISDQLFFQDMNERINTVRSYAAKALVVVFVHGLDVVMSGKFPDYQQPNLVFDAHVYDGFNGISPATQQPCQEPGGANWTPEGSGFARIVSSLCS
jgi:hypothetical protein